MQPVVVLPVQYIPLLHKVQGADQLHARKIGAVQLGHHGVDLAAVKHAHKNGLDHVVVVMAKGDLVAAQGPGAVIEVSAAHTGAQVAGGLVHVHHRIKYVGLEYLHRNVHQGRIFLDEPSVGRVVARVHDDEFQLEVCLGVAL